MQYKENQFIYNLLEYIRNIKQFRRLLFTVFVLLSKYLYCIVCGVLKKIGLLYILSVEH